MEEKVEYTTGTEQRRGKRFVGGYLSIEAADRLRKAADLRDATMTDLLEYMAGRLTATYEVQGCACSHE